MTAACSPLSHEWDTRHATGASNPCRHCGAGRYEPARVQDLEHFAKTSNDVLTRALQVIDDLRPLADASRALLASQVHRCNDGACTLCSSIEALRVAVDGLAPMLAEADAAARRDR